MDSMFGLPARSFTFDKTIRDPVHGDIMVTRLEVAVIDTRAFQRLRGVKQLGTADLIYPSARHTRFEHSLGTLAMADRIVYAINENPKRQSPVPISPEGRYFTRLLALLHDIGHVPYGHTLEDETKVLSTKHDKDVGRLKYFMEMDAPNSIADRIGPELYGLILDALVAKSDDHIAQLRFPYAVDIVANTVCADLLDYLKRDAYFTGLRQAYDERFIDYFMLVQKPDGSDADGAASKEEGSAPLPYEGRPALIIKKGDRVKWSVLSEVIKLLRLRYELGERVYFHHAKIVTSAMLSRAVQAVGYDVDKIRDWADDVLIHEIEHSKGKSADAKLARRLVSGLRQRRLYKPVYIISRSKAEVHCALPTFSELHESAKTRLEKESEFCADLGLPDGSVIFYAPDPEMNLKEADVKVKWIDDSVVPLRTIRQIQDEKTQPIHHDHENLWTFYVLLDPDHFDASAVDLAQRCLEEWRIPNDVASLSSHGVPLDLQALLQAAEEKGMQVGDMRALWQREHTRAARSGKKTDGPPANRRNKAYWLEEIDLFLSEADGASGQLFDED